jgi:dihydropyrimidine dehydrogenase (NAD+) subunit PreA
MVRRDDGAKHETWKERTADGRVPTTFDDELAGGLGHYVPEPSMALKKK